MVYGVVPPLIATVAVEPFTTVTEEGLAVKAATVAVTVIATVTVFAGDELSFTMTLVEPASTPVTDSVAPLIAAVATEEFGVAIRLATVTGTLTVDVPAPFFTTMVAVQTARPVTVSVVSDILYLTIVVSEFEFTEYGTVPPDIVTDAVPPTSNETDAGVATNTVSGGLVG